MNPRFLAKSLLLGLIALAISTQANAQSTFIFGFDLDGDNPVAAQSGSTFTATASEDPSLTLDFNVLSSLAAEYDTTVAPPVATGEDIAAAFLTSNNGLIIDNPSLDDAQSTAATETTGEDGFLNGGETFTFSFGSDVVFTEIDFFGVGTNSNNGVAEMPEIIIDGTSFIFPSNSDSDTTADPFGVDNVIAAGTEITITSSIVSDTFGVQDFTVTATPAAIPEPSSLAIIGLGSLLMVTRRRR